MVLTSQGIKSAIGGIKAANWWHTYLEIKFSVEVFTKYQEPFLSVGLNCKSWQIKIKNLVCGSVSIPFIFSQPQVSEFLSNLFVPKSGGIFYVSSSIYR